MTAHPAGPRWVFAAAPIAFLLAGCVAGSASPVPSSPAASPSPAAVPTAAPDLAQVVCGTDPVTSLSTPVVRPRADGVHVRTTNPTGDTRSIQVEDIGGDNAVAGVSESIWQVAPGTVRVRCFDTLLDNGLDVGWVSLTIVDPEGVFQPTTLDCVGDRVREDIDYAANAEGRMGDPVELTKALVTTVRPSDKVESAGYPAAETRLVRVIRDGRAIAIAEWTPAQGGGWSRTGATVCAGDAISWGS